MERSKDSAELCSVVQVQFENTPISAVSLEHRDLFLARQVGAALGYHNDGQRLVTSVGGEWAEELVEGTDYIVLRNGKLAAFKAAAPDLVDARAPSVMLLTESGVHLVALLSRQPAAKRLRRWLAEEVLPQIRRTGSYAPAQAEAKAPARKIKGGALHPEAAEALRAGLEEVTRGGGLTDEGRARLAQLVDHLAGTRVRALLAGPRSDAQRIEDEIRAALGPEPSESFRAISWNVTKDFLLQAALARGTPPDAEGRLLVLLQRKHAIDAWLDWQRKHGRISETAFTHLVKMLEGAVSLACGPLPGLS